MSDPAERGPGPYGNIPGTVSLLTGTVVFVAGAVIGWIVRTPPSVSLPRAALAGLVLAAVARIAGHLGLKVLAEAGAVPGSREARAGPAAAAGPHERPPAAGTVRETGPPLAAGPPGRAGPPGTEGERRERTAATAAAAR